jgi:hypothetical protein
LCKLFRGHDTRRGNQRRVKAGVADGGIGDLFMRTFIGKPTGSDGRTGAWRYSFTPKKGKPNQTVAEEISVRRKNFLEGGSKIWRRFLFMILPIWQGGFGICGGRA